MAFAAFVLSLVIAGIGAVGVLMPSVLLALAAAMRSPCGLYLAAAMRVLFGTALFVAAPRSRAPSLFRVLGVVTIAAGLALPVLGLDRFDAIVGWWIAQGTGVTRLWAAAALGSGLSIAYGIIPKEAR
jgi:hypothetical protein